jgi:hypothetical protein
MQRHSANGDGINDSLDRPSSVGTTVVDLWLVSDRQADGSPATCDPDSQLSINSYEFILRASEGEIEWGAFVNYQATMTVSFGEVFNNTEYHNGQGGGLALPQEPTSCARSWSASCQARHRSL